MKYILKKKFFLILLASVFAAGGCGKNPEDQAAEKAGKQIEKAVRTVQDYKAEAGGHDFQAAIEEVEKARDYAEKAGGKAEQVNLLAGRLYKAKAEKLSDKLNTISLEAGNMIEDAGEKLSRVSEYASDMEMVKMLSETGTSEKQKLQELLAEKSGIEAKISEKKAQLSTIEAKVSEYKSKIEDVKSSLINIKSETVSLFNKAELKSGETRAKLEDKAFSILRGKANGDSQFSLESELQKFMDKLEPLEDEKESIENLLSMLKSDAQEVKNRIDFLKNMDSELGFSEQLSYLGDLIEKGRAYVKDKTGSLDSVIESFSARTSEIENTYSQAMQAYSQVKGNLTSDAAVQKAQVQSSLVSLRKTQADFFETASKSLNNLQSLQQQEAAVLPESLIEKCEEKLSEAEDKINEAFEKSFELYQNAVEAADTSSGKDAAARGYMAQIYSRLKLAEEKGGNEQLKDELLKKLDSIKDYSIKHDPQFGTSYLAGLFKEYGIDFKTAQQKLMEKYENAKVAFSQVSGMQEQDRLDRLIYLITEFNKLEKPEDQQAYQDIVKSIFELHKEDWIELSEDPANSEALDPFSDLLAQEVQPAAETQVEEGAGEAEAEEGIAGGEPNMP
ncbi:hypothetical protein L21SP3_00230 [Sedimentisphaera cyanobacteriorum]|uniref:DUF4398 domain-containing protein n=1 Tax=Sedimentisphaera cyanobacteriorum TaxID=1940790 RepID=A0A1Q2HMJ1_9BACT|nr:hypothetical protein [Sedimentisphaera cyanobacteriorum]AQQ08453.1 hypothetical protein L21SP3_00230 [Sedimentisphaera cyanobacteriorum]